MGDMVIRRIATPLPSSVDEQCGAEHDQHQGDGGCSDHADLAGDDRGGVRRRNRVVEADEITSSDTLLGLELVELAPDLFANHRRTANRILPPSAVSGVVEDRTSVEVEVGAEREGSDALFRESGDDGRRLHPAGDDVEDDGHVVETDVGVVRRS